MEGTEGGFKSPEEVGLFVLIQAIRKKRFHYGRRNCRWCWYGSSFAVGAEGIQMGTRFVSSKESPVHENFKNYIFDSSLNGTWILNKTSKPVSEH